MKSGMWPSESSEGTAANTTRAEARTEVGGLRGAEAPLFHGAMRDGTPYNATRYNTTCEGATRCELRYRAGSLTVTTRSAATSRISCTIPEGQRISTRSADTFVPRPKCTGPALDEA
jgi:hypothetical protein